MCGIAGALNLRRDAPPRDLSDTVIRMRDAMPHRGPDGSGFWCDPETVHLGHRRLAIVDLTDQGHQPMAYGSGRYTITFNGEIYNFRELAKELVELGHRLSSTGDTQVLLAAIAQWGVEGALRRAVGMFAFAVWDAQTQTLHLARDRIGEKPLHLCEQNGVLYFASELRAFRVIEGFRRSLSEPAVSGYLQFGYVPEPLSIYQGVYKLPPGSILSVPARRDLRLNEHSLSGYGEGDSSGISPKRYWSCADVALESSSSLITDESDAAEQFEDILRQSVRSQIVCDVPIGCFLSGGVDSSLVAAVVQAESTSPVHTFTVRFDTPGFDESEHARRIADHLGTRHEEFLLSERDVMESVPSIIPELDEPTANGSFFAVRQISRLARTQATVVLSGDGGDELFAGYNRYQLAKRAWDKAARMPSVMRKGLDKALGGLTGADASALILSMFSFGSQASSRQLVDKLRRVLRAKDFAQCYDYVTSCWPRFALNVPAGARSRQWHALPQLDAMLLSDQVDYLPGDNLAKVDRASMAVSLETRLPILDHRLIELSWRTPAEMKVRAGKSKWLMRQVLEEFVPSALTERPKMGFSVPIESWMQSSLRSWAGDQFASESLADCVKGVIGVEPTMLNSHKISNRYTAYQRWSLAVLGAWVEGQKPGG